MKLDYLDAVSVSDINFNRSLRLDQELRTRTLQDATLSFVQIEDDVNTLEVFDRGDNY